MEYEKPTMYIVQFKTEDIVCASGGLIDGGKNDGGWIS